MQFSYLDPQVPRARSAQESLFFGLTIEMAKELVSSLTTQINDAEKNGTQH
nr:MULTISPECIES: hypothetical protein [unclassified Pantoea]